MNFLFEKDWQTILSVNPFYLLRLFLCFLMRKTGQHSSTFTINSSVIIVSLFFCLHFSLWHFVSPFFVSLMPRTINLCLGYLIFYATDSSSNDTKTARDSSKITRYQIRKNTNIDKSLLLRRNAEKQASFLVSLISLAVAAVALNPPRHTCREKKLS